MKNKDFSTTISIEATPQQVFEAIQNVRAWWSENIDGETAKVGGEFSYHYQDVHRAKMRITEMTANQKIVWHVVDNYFKFTKDETEWEDTHIIFELSEKGGKTTLKFTHLGLVPTYECFQLCHDAWTHYIHDSLKKLIIEGKGNATPKDVEGVILTDEDMLTMPQNGASICHRLLIESPVEKVYEALTTQKGLMGWWTPETIAKAEIGSVSRFAFGPTYSKEMKIEELRPYSKIKWLCLKGAEEWLGTTLTFELEPHRKGCILFFHHDGWKKQTIEFASCSFDWALFFRSLKFLCETGKGFPYPDFNK